MRITSERELRDLYDKPKERSLKKVMATLDRHTKRFIGLSPFVLVATYGGSGCADCSPRGGRSGFVSVASDSRILLPDSKGNNRLDSLVNVIETGRIGLLFLVPGVDETLRVNGRAHITADPNLLALFKHETVLHFKKVSCISQ